MNSVRYQGSTTGSESLVTAGAVGVKPYAVIISQNGSSTTSYTGATSTANVIDSADAALISSAALRQISTMLGATNYAKVSKIVIRIDTTT